MTKGMRDEKKNNQRNLNKAGERKEDELLFVVRVCLSLPAFQLPVDKCHQAAKHHLQSKELIRANSPPNLAALVAGVPSSELFSPLALEEHQM
mmetsp:Transcript_52794/g.60663  ORF Transcript_52794/g.60663 Transcript_52794/m.60663 type:complete len:93 (+) Transcript_52794:118-396(+)